MNIPKYVCVWTYIFISLRLHDTSCLTFWGLLQAIWTGKAISRITGKRYHGAILTHLSEMISYGNVPLHVVYVVLTFTSHKETLYNCRKLLKCDCACHLRRKKIATSLSIFNIVWNNFKKNKAQQKSQDFWKNFMTKPSLCSMPREKCQEISLFAFCVLAWLFFFFQALVLFTSWFLLYVLVDGLPPLRPLWNGKTSELVTGEGGLSLGPSSLAVPLAAQVRSLNFSVSHFLHWCNKRLICETERCLKLSDLNSSSRRLRFYKPIVALFHEFRGPFYKGINFIHEDPTLVT